MNSMHTFIDQLFGCPNAPTPRLRKSRLWTKINKQRRKRR